MSLSPAPDPLLHTIEDGLFNISPDQNTCSIKYIVKDLFGSQCNTITNSVCQVMKSILPCR